jgi:hypothetical protein
MEPSDMPRVPRHGQLHTVSGYQLDYDIPSEDVMELVVRRCSKIEKFSRKDTNNWQREKEAQQPLSGDW